ncbi:MAG: hypothetical protein JWM21_619 [Acidobacteria bacterium]|nr:hypothetical protein [Acidobacteriota bacterium]
MSNQEITKPELFISHATTDGEFANAVKQEIEKVFANGVDVFCTSSPGTIQVGADWLQELETKLAAAQAIIVIVTPVSIEKSWLWFELGATWSKARAGTCKIYPLCAPEVEMGALPSPLDRLQALSMGETANLRLLFKALITLFGFGKISSFKATNITKRIPKYKNVKIKDVDLNDKRLYSGRYSSYSDEELKELIDTAFLFPDNQSYKKYGERLLQGREDLIRNGKLLHFKKIDGDLDLPPGTAKRLLTTVAQRYNLVPQYQEENVIRFTTKNSVQNFDH